MGRTAKKSLEYYPVDIDIFQDIRIRKLIKYQGGEAITVYMALLCLIYKNGYYLEWDDDIPFFLSENTRMDEDYIRKVIDFCLDSGLLSSALFASDKILTSKGIQTRYAAITKMCKRKTKITRYNLLDDDGSPQNSGNKENDKGTEAPPVEKQATQKDSGKKDTEAKMKSPAADNPKPHTAPATIDDEIRELKGEQAWIDQLQVIHRMDAGSIVKALDDFANHCKADGKDRHTNLSDAKFHFNNWLRIIKEKKDDRLEKTRRKGSVLRAETKKEYSESF